MTPAHARRLLDVERDADVAQIRTAFHDALRAAHPDIARSPDPRLTRALIEAYRVLSDPTAVEAGARPGARSAAPARVVKRPSELAAAVAALDEFGEVTYVDSALGLAAGLVMDGTSAVQVLLERSQRGVVISLEPLDGRSRVDVAEWARLLGAIPAGPDC